MQSNKVHEHEKYRVRVEQYKQFRRDGYLIVKNLVSEDEVQELLDFTEAMQNAEVHVTGIPSPPDNLSAEERRTFYERLHMPHRSGEIFERFLLHPRVADVLEALIGPDVLALQTILFFKQPGQIGQGFHQDSYYIPTQPDTLCGAWLALDPATKENGCLWVTPGSHIEPVYPDCDGISEQGDIALADISQIKNASHPDVQKNTVADIALQYEEEIAVELDPGDMVFFGGHIFHRSHTNNADYPRRAFVSHYCNARSRVPWNHGYDYEGDAANHEHILLRGSTHLGYRQPRFGTACAANMPERYGHVDREPLPKSMMGHDNGYMVLTPHDTDEHEH